MTRRYEIVGRHYRTETGAVAVSSVRRRRLRRATGPCGVCGPVGSPQCGPSDDAGWTGRCRCARRDRRAVELAAGAFERVDSAVLAPLLERTLCRWAHRRRSPPNGCCSAGRSPRTLRRCSRATQATPRSRSCWGGPDICPSTTPWRSSAGATRHGSIGPAGPYVIANRQDVIIGSTGLDVETAHRAGTGYVLARDAWGHGYATEATRAMGNLADQLGIGRLYALCHPDNRASVRVLEKAGFSFEGVLRRHTVFPNLDPTCGRDVECWARLGAT
jgi:RimJ/RimL family protein N-acetyltransferase